MKPLLAPVAPDVVLLELDRSPNEKPPPPPGGAPNEKPPLTAASAGGSAGAWPYF